MHDVLIVGAGVAGLDTARSLRATGLAVPSPQRSALLASRQASVDGLHFAGDWTSETAVSHGAFAEGRRGAEQLRLAGLPR